MSDLILFGSGMDQSLPTEVEFQGVREKVDRSVDEAIRTHDLDKATELVRSLIKVAKISGRELTRVLYKFQTHWAVFGTEETFEEWADRETGLHHHTIERYIRIETLLTKTDLTPEIKLGLADKNLAELFPIANMVEQGYEPTQEEWEDIVKQPDETSIRTKVREIKGQAPRATALVLYMDNAGSIWATKDGNKKFVGSLSIEDESEIIQMAVERITHNSGILRG